ncbi:MAG: sigma-70 family RNA polymerase sigma factor [Bacteroidales bacterium]|nr:sigma-70 family RNA polymerase sigma factor [Bacteroidales bacterium]
MEIKHFSKIAIRDNKLVKLALKGDRNAYAQLMKNHEDALYSMLLKMTGNSQDADDLTIEAFSKAFKNLDKYTPDYAFSTWLYKIATNNCIDFIRKRKKMTYSLDKSYPSTENQKLSNILDSKTLNPEQYIILKEKIKFLRDIVDTLKPHYKKLVELRYFKEYSYQEIVTELNIPIGTVKAQLFRARELLYNILKNTEEKI